MAPVSSQNTDTWLERLILQAREPPQAPLHPSIVAFGEAVGQNATLHKLCNSMLAQARLEGSHPHGDIDNLPLLLRLFNAILTQAPTWENTDSSESLVGLPFNRVLLVLMRTPSGLDFFRRSEVNQHIKAILQQWTLFLESDASLYVLNSTDGWLSPSALAKLESIANSPANGRPHRSFVELFECPNADDPDTLGFPSWDAFFSRRFRPGIRPLPSVETLSQKHHAGPVVNACESKPWAIVRDCSRQHHVWLKGQPYSIPDMLDHDPLTRHFVRGTVYQAYLSALSYHRLHAPVSGTVRRVRHVDGAYFSHAPMSTPLAMEYSQSYLAGVAARALVFIESSDPRVGLLCLVAVGMGEVSSCQVAVREGDVVRAGDEVGSFHYGGSTHCVVFSNQVDVEFEPAAEESPGSPSARNLAVNSLLGWCVPRTQ